MITILLIEDNIYINENVMELLQLSGYRVITANSGKAGLHLAKAELPDIILCDIIMPLLSGYEVFTALKNDDDTKDIPFVYMTSSVEKKEVQAAMDKGANGYIMKPFDEKQLLDAIHNCLDTGNG